MAVTTKIEPISQWIEATIDKDLAPKARGQALASFAAGQLLEAQQTNARILGRVPPHETFVDGRRTTTLDSVTERSTISFEFELMMEVLSFIGQRLVEQSPVTSGRYRDAHTLFADGVEVDPGGTIPAAEEYAFLNPLPYARKIEIGKTRDGRDFVVQVPNRIYERTAAEAKRRFGNVARVYFSYRAAMGRSSVFQISRVGPLQVKRDVSNPDRKLRGRFVKGSHVRAGNTRERALRVPSIIVTFN